jgi:hypothetical protein
MDIKNEQLYIVTYLDTHPSAAGVTAGVTVRYGEELSALLPSVLDKAFKGEL